jgi:hypothetical protein
MKMNDCLSLNKCLYLQTGNTELIYLTYYTIYLFYLQNISYFF